MRVDYHVHLEEGPYTARWLNRTSEAMLSARVENYGTRAAMVGHLEKLLSQARHGAYNSAYLDLYLEEAVRKGIRQVGIVDHLYRFKETRAYFEAQMCVGDDPLGRLQRTWLDHVMTEEMDDFVHFIMGEKAKWAARGVSLRLGLEADYFPGAETELAHWLSKYPWDFVNGSVHFFRGWGFDNPETVGEFDWYDLSSLYAAHFDTVCQMIDTRLFDFVSHLDNVKVFGHRPADEMLLVSEYMRVADQLVSCDVATEVNTGLLYRYPVKEACPSPLFTSVLAQKGVQFTLSSDTHYPDTLGYGLDDSICLLQSAGIKQVATFSERRREMVEITL
ncbi:MAG: PHP domain-containing protein [Bacilli bacterium]